ncbi:MAG: glycosyltransferase family 4 protein [Anaerolineae bacterium]|nr:glycosyltransferase family 4 protein [Anaerolineae bacterium]
MSIVGIDASRAVSAAPTGTEAYATHLIRRIVAELDVAHAIRLYFREAPPAFLSDGTSNWRRVENRIISFPRLWTHVRLSWEMLLRPPDLLFVPSHVLPLLRPRRTLVTVHDLGYLAFPEAHPAGQRRYLDWSTRWNVHAATHVLADSVATRDAIVEAYGVASAKITVVYPGYDADLAPVRDGGILQRVRARYGIRGDYILFIGRIQPRKNLRRLIEAFAQIAGDHPGLTLILAGPQGWFTEPIEARVRALGLTERISFPGYVATEDKAALISGARLFAYPSLHEGFGFPALEAQACGTPLLTSTTSSLPEVTGDGGVLVDPEQVDAIAGGLQRLLTDAELRERLIARGFENLRRFSWTKAARQVCDIIEGLLSLPTS